MEINNLIEQMTLEEKAALCTGASAWTTTPVERLDVPELIMADGPHGVRHVPDVNAIATESLPVTCFPTASCLASTWDKDALPMHPEDMVAGLLSQVHGTVEKEETQ